jgi:hypothetical protein
MIPGPLIPKHVVAETDGRIAIPRNLCGAVNWLTGTDPLQAWLLLVQEGRHRLLSDEQVQKDPMLEPIRMLVLEGRSASPSEPTFAEEPMRATLVARLVPTTISHQKGDGWRISFPKALEVFAPGAIDLRAFSILVSLEGYLEIWYTDVLRKFGVQPLRSRPGVSPSLAEI